MKEWVDVISATSDIVSKWTDEEYAAYVADMRVYYEKLPTDQQPENWPAIREQLDERDAIQKLSDHEHRNRSIFTRTP